MSRLEDDIRAMHGDDAIEITEVTELPPAFGGQRRFRVAKPAPEADHPWYVKAFAAAALVPIVIFLVLSAIGIAGLSIFLFIILRVMFTGH